MGLNKLLDEKLKNPFDTLLYYLVSTEEPLLREAVEQVKNALGDCELVQVEQPVPDFNELEEYLQTLSFIGAPRVVELKGVVPGSFTDKEIKRMDKLFATLQDTVLIVCVAYADKKAGDGKRAKNLFDAAKNHGFALALTKPGTRENIGFIQQAAQAQGAQISYLVAQNLLEQVGSDRLLLKNETAKLAAIAGYTEISAEIVKKNAVSNIEADVFELSRCITAQNKAKAFDKLTILLQQRNEPIAISAVLSGSFVDMYRARCGTEQKIPVAKIFSEMGYFGNSYRMQKAKESAMRYTRPQLERCILILTELDKQLKSSALSDKSILLEAAISRLLRAGCAA